MNFDPWLLVGVAAVDLLLLGTLYWGFRTSRPVDRRIVLPVGINTVIFAAHAFIFFSGALLVLQLLFLVSLFGLFVLLSAPVHVRG